MLPFIRLPIPPPHSAIISAGEKKLLELYKDLYQPLSRPARKHHLYYCSFLHLTEPSFVCVTASPSILPQIIIVPAFGGCRLQFWLEKSTSGGWKSQNVCLKIESDKKERVLLGNANTLIIEWKWFWSTLAKFCPISHYISCMCNIRELIIFQTKNNSQRLFTLDKFRETS